MDRTVILMKINYYLQTNLVLDMVTLQNMHGLSLLSKLVNPLTATITF